MESDDKLMLRCQEGDASAFDQIVQHHRTTLFNFIYRFINDRESAEELTQEVFIRIYKNIGKFRPELSGFRTWMYRIASNLCKNELRNRSRHSKIITKSTSANTDEKGDNQIEKLQDASPGPDIQLEQNELREILNSAISYLPEKYRTVIILRDIEDMPYGDIAKIINKPEGTVKSRLNRARHMLKDKMKDYIQ